MLVASRRRLRAVFSAIDFSEFLKSPEDFRFFLVIISAVRYGPSGAGPGGPDRSCAEKAWEVTCL